jgi:hypothetical protein
VLRCCPESTAGIRENGAQMGPGRLRRATTEREWCAFGLCPVFLPASPAATRELGKRADSES